MKRRNFLAGGIAGSLISPNLISGKSVPEKKRAKVTRAKDPEVNFENFREHIVFKGEKIYRAGRVPDHCWDETPFQEIEEIVSWDKLVSKYPRIADSCEKSNTVFKKIKVWFNGELGTDDFLYDVQGFRKKENGSPELKIVFMLPVESSEDYWISQFSGNFRFYNGTQLPILRFSGNRKIKKLENIFENVPWEVKDRFQIQERKCWLSENYSQSDGFNSRFQYFGPVILKRSVFHFSDGNEQKNLSIQRYEDSFVKKSSEWSLSIT